MRFVKTGIGVCVALCLLACSCTSLFLVHAYAAQEQAATVQNNPISLIETAVTTFADKAFSETLVVFTPQSDKATTSSAESLNTKETEPEPSPAAQDAEAKSEVFYVLISGDASNIMITAGHGRYENADKVIFEIVGSQKTRWVQPELKSNNTWYIQTATNELGYGETTVNAWATKDGNTTKIDSTLVMIPEPESASIQTPSNSATQQNTAKPETTQTETTQVNTSQPKTTPEPVVILTPAVVEAEVSDGIIWLTLAGGRADTAWGASFCVYDSYGGVTWYQAEKYENGSWGTHLYAIDMPSGYATVEGYAMNGSDPAVLIGSTEFYCPYIVGENMTAYVQGFGSETGYLIAIDCTNNILGVYTGGYGNWNLLSQWDVTTGAYDTPTIHGVFSVGYKGYSFDSYGVRSFYYTQFYGEYYMHSICYWPEGGIADGRLGMNLSHGCVRMAIENAIWIQDNIPYGSTVVVY